MHSITVKKNYYKKSINLARQKDDEKIITSSLNKQKGAWNIINEAKINSKTNHSSLDSDTFFEYCSDTISNFIKKIVNLQVDFKRHERFLKKISKSSRSFFIAPATSAEIQRIICNLSNLKPKDVHNLSSDLLKLVVGIVKEYNTSIQYLQ